MLQSQALEILNKKIENCNKCEELCGYRKTHSYLTVPGSGYHNAHILILGEAPGANEAQQGQPFVGKSGRLLMDILQKAGWSRDTVYITNTVKCRPPNNRDPLPSELANCRKFLDLQIKCINPEWIICLGKVASVSLLGKEPDCTIGSLRRITHLYQNRKVICTFHPSYLLRNPSAKKSVWEDLQPVIRAT